IIARRRDRSAPVKCPIGMRAARVFPRTHQIKDRLLACQLPRHTLLPAWRRTSSFKPTCNDRVLTQEGAPNRYSTTPPGLPSSSGRSSRRDSDASHLFCTALKPKKRFQRSVALLLPFQSPSFRTGRQEPFAWNTTL